MRFAECLSSSKGFIRLLKELARDTPDPELLEDPDWDRPPVLAEFLTREWARGKNPGSDRRTAFVLLVAYYTRLLLEQVRFGCKRYLRLGAMLFLAQYVWPSYEVWVGGLPPLPGDRSLSACLSWLTAPGRLASALRDLGVSDPEAPELRVSPQDLDRDRSTLYGWLGQARDLVYRQIWRELELEGDLLREPTGWESAALRRLTCEAPGSYQTGPGRDPARRPPATRRRPRRTHSSSSPMRSSQLDP
jgi:hypothetical protein